MNAYSYDNNGKYIGIYDCQIDPIATRREGYNVYLLPANATFFEPPEYNIEMEIPVWNGKQWGVETLLGPDQAIDLDPTPEPTVWDELAAAITEGVNAV